MAHKPRPFFMSQIAILSLAHDRNLRHTDFHKHLKCKHNIGKRHQTEPWRRNMEQSRKWTRDPRKAPIFATECPDWWAGVGAARAGVTNPDFRRGPNFVEGWIVGKLYPALAPDVNVLNTLQ